MTKKIALNGKHGTGQFALVDDSDFTYLSKFRWSVNNSGYAVRRFYDRETKRDRQVLMHRQILGALTSELVDHRNRDRLDNRRSNIRLCNASQNVINRETSSRRTSYRGVVPTHKATKNPSWQARIVVKRRVLHLGTFKTETAAAAAYNQAAREVFGDFAILNDVKS